MGENVKVKTLQDLIKEMEDAGYELCDFEVSNEEECGKVDIVLTFRMLGCEDE